MKLYLATENRHKLGEIKLILSEYNIVVEQAKNFEKIEPKDWPIEKVAKENAKRLADETKRPIIVDDSGCFFNTYNEFPGQLSNWVFKKIGYEGLLKLLEGKDRTAVFRCAAAVCFPGKEPVVFVGEMKGSIALQPARLADPFFEPFPYERIFIIDGFSVPVCEISREEKNRVSHRSTAFRKLGVYIQKYSS